MVSFLSNVPETSQRLGPLRIRNASASFALDLVFRVAVSSEYWQKSFDPATPRQGEKAEKTSQASSANKEGGGGASTGEGT